MIRCVICPRYHIVKLNYKITTFIIIVTLLIMRMSMCLVLFGLFVGSFASPLDIVNNCDRKYTVQFYTKPGPKFNPWFDNQIGEAIYTIPSGISSYDANDSYIEVWETPSPVIFDEYGSRLSSEKFTCDEFDEENLCSKLRIPTRELFYVGDMTTVFMCSVENDLDIVSIVNNCDYEPSMFVYQSSDDKIKNFKPDANESFNYLATGATTFVVKKGALTFIELLTTPLNSTPSDPFSYDLVFPPSKFFDDTKKPVVPVEFMCMDLSPDCGSNAEDKVKMIDVTNTKTLYMCSVDKNDELVYDGRKMLIV